MAENYTIVFFDGIAPATQALSGNDLMIVSQDGQYSSRVSLSTLLSYISNNFSAGSIALGSLSNVQIGSVANGQFLRYNSATGKWTNQTVTIPTALTQLSDVAIATPAGNQFLRYDAATSKWKNVTVAIPAGLGDLSNVTLTGLVDGQILKFDAALGKFKPFTPIETIATQKDVILTNIANNDVIVYDSALSKFKNIKPPKHILQINGYLDYTPEPNVFVMEYEAISSFDLLINLLGCRFKAAVPPTTGDAVLELLKNGIVFATVTFLQNSSTVTMSSPSLVGFNDTDVLSIRNLYNGGGFSRIRILITGDVR